MLQRHRSFAVPKRSDERQRPPILPILHSFKHDTWLHATA
jgi:hypothetical protein